MKRQNFSEISNTLFSNGVGFIECYFRCNHTFDDLETLSQGERLAHKDPVIIDFSDGVSYLGTAIIPKSNSDTSRLRNASVHEIDKKEYSVELYIEKIDTIETRLFIDLVFEKDNTTTGLCVIELKEDQTLFEE